MDREMGVAGEKGWEGLEGEKKWAFKKIKPKKSETQWTGEPKRQKWERDIPILERETDRAIVAEREDLSIYSVTLYPGF